MSERIDASRRWSQDAHETTPSQQQKRRLAEAMRVVIERLVTSDVPEEELRAVAARLEDYAAHLATHPEALEVQYRRCFPHNPRKTASAPIE